jgi:CubicO group peptidase (beta-lactamase class C family)
MDRTISGPGDQIDTKAIEDYILSKMKSFKIPGVALSIVKNDRIVYLKGYGRASVRGNPVTPRTSFNIASVYKSFIGLAISQLIDAGKIDIDAPVKTYLPWFTLADLESTGQITIKHLLSHTSGLSQRSGIMVLYTNPVSLERLVRNLSKIRLSRPVGSTYQYSNLNYFILAEVVETVSGMPYGHYIETNIFKPLDMRHSYTSQAKAKKNGLATGYTVLLGLMIPFFRPENKAFIHLFISSEDMAHYMVAQLNNGTYDSNSVISGQGMTRTHTPLMPEICQYGMGWTINHNNIAHNGAMENFRADVFMRKGDNGDRWGVAVLINSMDVISSDLGVTEVPYGNIAYDIVQLLHGENPTNTYSPPKITISNIGKAAIIVPLYLIAGISFLTLRFRNILGSK